MRNLWYCVAVLFATAVLSAVPVSPQMTSHGIEMRLDEANAITYRRARVATRRAYRYDRRSYRRAYVAPVYRRRGCVC